MAIELHLDVELLAPATVFFVQRLKSNLGEVLMLMLSSFSRVPQVSTLVRGVAVAVILLHAASYTRAPLHCAAVRAGFVRPHRPSRRPALPLVGLAVSGALPLAAPSAMALCWPRSQLGRSNPYNRSAGGGLFFI